jgi:hypothetical protein
MPVNNEMQTDAEELTPAKLQEAGILVDLFGTGPVACFFSKAWNLRVAGITKLAELIGGLKHEDQMGVFLRFCSIMKHRLKETHKSVFHAAVEALKSTIKALGLNQSDVTRCISLVMPLITAKLGCQQKNLSDIACDFVLWLADQHQWEIVSPILTNPMKNQSQFRLAQAQLEMLAKVILKNGKMTGIPGLNVPLIMGFVIPCVESAKVEVRKAAVEILVIAEAICGSTIYQYFDKFRPKVKEIIMAAIQQSKSASAAGDKGAGDAQRNSKKGSLNTSELSL